MSDAAPKISVLLNVMGRLELADYGFRSWMLQDAAEPYEVVLNLFNDQRPRYEKLAEGRSPQCRLVIKEYDRPGFFNIAAANNLGAFVATGSTLLVANSDVAYPSKTIDLVTSELVDRGIKYAGLTRVNLTPAGTAALKPVTAFQAIGSMDAELPKAEEESRWGHQGWMIDRQTFLDVGGYDLRVMVAEDRDLRTRAVHFLARTGRQRTSIVAESILGYHPYHATRELWDLYDPAAAIFKPREERLAVDPTSTEDVVDTDLTSIEVLKKALRDTPVPKPKERYRRQVLFKVWRRTRNAARVFVGKDVKW